MAFPKFAFVSLLLVAGLAHADGDLVAAPESAPALTEAQRCEQSLARVHEDGLARDLKSIRKDAEFNEMTIQAMRQSGQITDALGERRVRAKLLLGAQLLKMGLFHEAIYSAFLARYESVNEIADALRSFSQISTSSQQGVLISEVIERVLQYIPDVDAGNVNKLSETAKFVGMNETQLRDFRTKWIEYDRDDSFADVLQGGILAMLTSGNEDMIKSVKERSGWFKRKMAGWKAIPIPNRPQPLDAKLSEREIQEQDRPYYDDAELLEYLRRSTTAARQFFLTVRSSVLTREQIIGAVQNKEAFNLKASLVDALERELKWRNELTEKYKVYAELERSRGEAQRALDRLENRRTFDQNQVQKDVGEMRRIPGVDGQLAKALDILKNNLEVVDSGSYVGVVSIIVTNAGPMVGHGAATLALVDAAVTHANEIGLIPDHANALSRLLTSMVSRLNGREAKAADLRLRDIKATTPEFEGQSIDQIKAARTRIDLDFELARTELNETFARKF